MHIYFSGIGGRGVGPLALIASQAGYRVSGSDLQDSHYIQYLLEQGIEDIHIGQTTEQIAKVHRSNPIDWFVYSSALPIQFPNNPELVFVKENGIRSSKRDELLNEIITDKQLKLLAIAGTHGKTTTTAMVMWLFTQLGEPLSYSVGASVSFAQMGKFDPKSQYFAYECDEFDNNFLAFHPHMSIITGCAWDHHEIFPTQDDYYQAFRKFITQSRQTILWQEDNQKLKLTSAANIAVEDYDNPKLKDISLAGLYNRRDAWLAVCMVAKSLDRRTDELIDLINKFPGVDRRFEKLADNLYSDYAHTPEKIAGLMSVAKETAKQGQKLIIVFEPLTNRRMHYMAEAHRDVFDGAEAIYWVPTYLAREDPNLRIQTPEELIVKSLSPANQKIAVASQLDDQLQGAIAKHLDSGDMVVAVSGGGGGSLDEWLRQHFVSKT